MGTEKAEKYSGHCTVVNERFGVICKKVKRLTVYELDNFLYRINFFLAGVDDEKTADIPS
jgi:hypothetical protein